MALIKLPETAPIYTVMQRFVDAALASDDSLFDPGRPIWSLETITALYKAFVEQPDTSSQSFLDKFKKQLAQADARTILLAAELLYVHLVPLNGISAEKKRSQIREVLSWATSPLTSSIPPVLDRVLEMGIAKASIAMMVGKPFQLAFLLDAVRHWKQLPAEERSAALSDPWAFKRFLFAIPIKFAFAQRELLLHLVHPATFEATMAREHKQQIAACFADLVDGTIVDIDQRLLQVRQKLTPHYGKNFNFYEPQLKAQWLEAPDSEDSPSEPDDEELGKHIAAPKGGTDMQSLLAWQANFQSENVTSRMVAADYPQWLLHQFGHRIALRTPHERALNVYVDGKLYQELWLNRVQAVYVLLYDGPAWDIARLRANLTRPRSLKMRKGYGMRFFVTNTHDYNLLQQITRQVLSPDITPAVALPRSLGDKLRPYVQLAIHLGNRVASAQDILDQWLRISPRPGNPSEAPSPQQLVRDLIHLRLLQQLGDGQYQRWEHLRDGTLEHMLRYAALTMLIPDGDGYRLPALEAPFDGPPAPASAWPLQGALLPWYEEAGLVQQRPDGTWQATADALQPLAVQTPTAQALATFLGHLQAARQSPRGLAALSNTPLRPLSPSTLEKRIAELQGQLLIERDTILRIYRSLIAGQHVILSGPPGTGKTHLAGLLPQVFWRDESETIMLQMPTDPELPPTMPPAEESIWREGYRTMVVTATEDWGVRHVLGGIAPQLQQSDTNTTLVYTIQHGHLSKAVLSNYQGYDGSTIPLDLSFQRAEIRDQEERSYRGIWLVIDEFTRAQVDAAFGSLLTTLGGQAASLAVPIAGGAEQQVPLPPDFRLIGTLNSFDRHFLNQMSEAMKRRFAFIDMLPPSRAYAEAEQGMAIFNALKRLHAANVGDIRIDDGLGSATIPDLLSIRREATPEAGQTHVSYRLQVSDSSAQQALSSFWQLFTAIRLYRQLGTAQAEAVYTALFAGRSINMTWELALDSALADTLADQLQVLARDEQRVLLALLEHSTDAAALLQKISAILKQLPGPRQIVHLSQLKAAENPQLPHIDDMQPDSLKAEQIAYLFNIGAEQPTLIPANGLFAQRLRAFISERGL